MRRRHVHFVFALGTLAFASLAVYEGVQLSRTERVNEAIARAQADALDSAIPEARFARAVKVAESGHYDEAVAQYKALLQSDHVQIRRSVFFNLGNLHLREALEHGREDEARWLPTIEFAKQSYRSLLREDPSDWDARHNLELALRLAPELEESFVADGEPPDNEEATSTVQHARMDLP